MCVCNQRTTWFSLSTMGPGHPTQAIGHFAFGTILLPQFSWFSIYAYFVWNQPISIGCKPVKSLYSRQKIIISVQRKDCSRCKFQDLNSNPRSQLNSQVWEPVAVTPALGTGMGTEDRGALECAGCQSSAGSHREILTEATRQKTTAETPCPPPASLRSHITR